MTTQPVRYNPRPSTGYNPRFSTSYNIPDKQPPVDVSNKIFMKVGIGKYFEIKRAIAQEKSSLNLRDANMKTVLHWILPNTNLSKHEKYELSKFVIELGAPIDDPDNDGVRPLHLASGQQNKELVKLLLEKGADANSRDNKHMTALHYAVSPDTFMCKKKKHGVVPETRPTIDFRTDALFNQLYEFFKADKTIMMYTTHLANIFKYYHVFPNRKQDTEDLKKEVTTVMSERNVPGIEQSYKDKLVNMRKKLYKTVVDGMGKSMTRLDIKENLQNGWAPEIGGKTEKTDAFLPVANLRYAFGEIFDPLYKSFGSALKSMSEQYNAAISSLDKLKTYVQESSKLLDELDDYRRFMELFEDDLVLVDIDPIKLKSMIHISNTLFNNLFNKTLEVPTADFAVMDNANTLLTNTNKQIFEHDKRAAYSPFMFFDGTNYGIGSTIGLYITNIETMLRNISKDIVTHITAHADKEIDIQKQGDTVMALANVQLKLTNVCYAIMLLDDYVKELRSSIKIFKIRLEDKETDLISNVLIYVAAYMEDMTQNHRDPANQDMSAHLIRFDDPAHPPKQLVATISNYDNLGARTIEYNEHIIMAKLVDDPIVVPADYIEYTDPTGVVQRRIYKGEQDIIGKPGRKFNEFIKDLDKIVADEQGSSSKRLSDLYNSVRALQEKLNGFIDTYNKLNGLIYTKKFNNDMIATTATSESTERIDYMLMTMMNHLVLVPESLSKFTDTLRPIFMSGGAYLPINGMNCAKRLIDSYGYTLSDDNKMIIIEHGARTHAQVNGTLTDLYLHVAHISPIILYKKVIQGTPSVIDYIPAIEKKKSVTADLTILGPIYDSHIYILKIIMIMYFVTKLAELHSKNKKDTNKQERPIYDEMTKIYTSIQSISQNNSHGTMLAILGRMTDDIIVSTLDNMANVSASHYIYDLSKQPALLPPAKFSHAHELITKPSDRTRLQGTDMLSSVITSAVASKQFFNPIARSIDIDVLQFFNSPDTEPFTEQNRLINFDDSTTDITKDMCYDIDEDVIANLLVGGADPNVPEKTGKTPLFMAVFLQNDKIVEALLRSGAKVVYNGTSTYNFCFQQLLNMIDYSPVLNIDEINKKVEDYLLEKTHTSSVFSNSKLILKMTMYMLDHQITSNASVYPNMWTRKNHLEILNLIGLKDVSYDLVPLARVDENIIYDNVRGYTTLTDTIDQYNIKLSNDRDIMIRLRNSIQNMELELKELNGSSTSRSSELEQLIKDLQDHIKQVNHSIRSSVKKIQQLVTTKETIDNKNAARPVVTAIKESGTLHERLGGTSRDVCSIYEVFFKDYIGVASDPGAVPGRIVPAKATADETNNEYATYTKLWHDLLSRPSREVKQDHTQLINNLQRYITDQGIVRPEIFLDAYEPICELYDKVLNKYGRDYLELSTYLNTSNLYDYTYNYVLKQIYCIMTHVFSHTMSINFINTVAQMLARQDRGRTQSGAAKIIYMTLKTSGFIKHCIKVVPKRVVKIVCKMPEGEKDPEVAMTVVDVLNTSIDLLTTGTVEGIDKNSLDSVKEIIVPFFSIYMETYTAEMHACMVKQIKLLMVQHRWLQILRLTAKKAVTEMKTVDTNDNRLANRLKTM